MTSLEVKTKDDFVNYVIGKFRNVPKCECEIKDIFDSIEDVLGECIVVNKAEDMHHVYIANKCFEKYELLMSIIAHESTHSAVHDMLYFLSLSGLITDEMYEFMSERLASLCEEIVLQILSNNEELKLLFDKLEK